MNHLVNQKRVLIIGASSGIGRALALHFAQDGALLCITARREELLQEIVSLYPRQVTAARLDVTDDDADMQLLALIEQMGGMDICVICAGMGKQNRALKSSIEMDTVATNVVGFTRMADAAFNYFRRMGMGHLAAITSIAGTRGIGICPSYSATKRYQSTYMESLAQLSRVERLPICITTIKPGFIDTDLIADRNYPLTLSLPYAANLIYKAIYKRRSLVVINWAWQLIVWGWQLIPRPLWIRMRIH